MNTEDITALIDVPSAKERFMGNYALFSRFLLSFPERSPYGELTGALAAGDVKAAFEQAHTLKGVAGNLSLKKIAAPLSDVVETLRAGNMPDEAAQTALREAYEATIAGIVQLRESGSALF